jgi:hypothetical protein
MPLRLIKGKPPKLLLQLSGDTIDALMNVDVAHGSTTIDNAGRYTLIAQPECICAAATGGD